jgi:hypothetical protein
VTALSPLGLAAMVYAQHFGWAVFPIVPRGKQPLIDGGFHNASTHPEQIAEWWFAQPDANIGFCPGSFGFVVVDIDGPEGESRANDVGAFDVPTLECITSRGVHRYFRLPDAVTIGNRKLEQIDIRAHAGYVLLPPSVHASGHAYSWRGELE